MKQEEKKKILSKQNLTTIFIVIIMVTSVLALWSSNSGDKLKYKSHTFTRMDNSWALVINKKELVFNFFPAEVDEINVSSDIISRLSSTFEIDSTSSPDNSYAQAIAFAQYNFGETLGRISNTYVRVGMTDKNNLNLPLIGCEDATPLVPVLFFKESESTKISLEGNCIIAEAKSETDVIRIKDRLLYGILGVI